MSLIKRATAEKAVLKFAETINKNTKITYCETSDESLRFAVYVDDTLFFTGNVLPKDIYQKENLKEKTKYITEVKVGNISYVIYQTYDAYDK